MTVPNQAKEPRHTRTPRVSKQQWVRAPTDPPAAPRPKPSSASESIGPIAPEKRVLMIAEAAYFIAERRGFEAGHDVEDWLAAEKQVATMLAGGMSPARGE